MFFFAMVWWLWALPVLIAGMAGGAQVGGEESGEDGRGSGGAQEGAEGGRGGGMEERDNGGGGGERRRAKRPRSALENVGSGRGSTSEAHNEPLEEASRHATRRSSVDANILDGNVRDTPTGGHTSNLRRSTRISIAGQEETPPVGKTRDRPGVFSFANVNCESLFLTGPFQAKLLIFWHTHYFWHTHNLQRQNDGRASTLFSCYA